MLLIFTTVALFIKLGCFWWERKLLIIFCLNEINNLCAHIWYPYLCAHYGIHTYVLIMVSIFMCSLWHPYLCAHYGIHTYVFIMVSILIISYLLFHLGGEDYEKDKECSFTLNFKRLYVAVAR